MYLGKRYHKAVVLVNVALLKEIVSNALLVLFLFLIDSVCLAHCATADCLILCGEIINIDWNISFLAASQSKFCTIAVVQRFCSIDSTSLLCHAL